MKYRDYKIIAKKHLDACKSIIVQFGGSEIPENVLREIHYLAGYIIEGIIVYAIYKHCKWGEDRDITEYDREFTQETKLDYYKNGQRRNKDTNQYINTGAEYCIISHGFNKYVEILREKCPGTNIPYVDNYAEIDEDVKTMISEWKSDLRYRYGNRDRHNQEEITKLVNTCQTIYQEVINNI